MHVECTYTDRQVTVRYGDKWTDTKCVCSLYQLYSIQLCVYYQLKFTTLVNMFPVFIVGVLTSSHTEVTMLTVHYKS